MVEGDCVKEHLKVHEVWSLESCVTSVVLGGLDSGDPPIRIKCLLGKNKTC